MLISPTSLATMNKFQKNICFKTRAVGLINIKTKECKSGRHLMKVAYYLFSKEYEVEGFQGIGIRRRLTYIVKGFSFSIEWRC